MVCGVAMIGAGLFYDLAFAGLPFQDPPPELWQSFAANNEELFATDFSPDMQPLPACY